MGHPLPMQKVLSLFLCLTLTLSSQAQKETTQWRLPFYAGLNFNTTPATIINNSSLQGIEACASIADTAGNLLFYTDGETVWNKQNMVMANGGSLHGNKSSAQCIIVHKPLSFEYYIFTPEIVFGRLCYSVVDMALVAGQGSVTVKNQTLFVGTSERVSATRHCNERDSWILTKDRNSSFFRAYLLTAAGLNTVPVLSAVSNPTAHGIGQLKFSPGGKKILFSDISGSYELFDFDRQTGLVTNRVILAQGSPYMGAYGVEFSREGNMAFGVAWGGGSTKIHQWDLCGISDSAIINSRYDFMSTKGGWLGSVQLAPTGIILASKDQESYLAAILSPSLAGASANYIDSLQSVGGTSVASSLPNFFTSYFRRKPATFTHTLDLPGACRSVSFASAPVLPVACDQAMDNYIGVSWDFGDPSSGALNTSTLSNPVHHFSTGGQYPVKVIYHRTSCAADTVTRIVTVPAGPALSVAGRTLICTGETGVMTASGAKTYTWNGTHFQNTYTFSPVSATLTLTGSDSLGCKSTLNVVVKKDERRAMK
jgi:PKD repeat protein